MNTVIVLSPATRVGKCFERTANINGIVKQGQGSDEIVATLRAVKAALLDVAALSEQAATAPTATTPAAQPAPTVAAPTIAPPAVQAQAATPAAPATAPVTTTEPPIIRNANGYRVDPSSRFNHYIGRRVKTDYGDAAGSNGQVMGLGDSPLHVMVRWDGKDRDIPEKPRFLKFI